MEHRVGYRVYYEDTDALGVVYYANYLKYLERGRSEFVAAMGRDIRDWNADGYLFVVSAVTMRYRRPAELGDWIEVVSLFEHKSPVRGLFRQHIERAGTTLVTAEVELACLGPDRKIRPFPPLAPM